ncbi:MAG: NUMOD3 domain-containing DNA-binding protein [Lachnospiraceae bacterium]
MTYKEFIDNILNTRGRFACGDEYHERHHIVPKCMNGTNDDENLIDLFAREHFEAHRLLALENPNNKKLVYAWWNMSHMNKAKNRDYEITAEEYEEAKTAFSKIQSEAIGGENHPMYGKHHSEETRKKISESNKGLLSGDKNPMFGIRRTGKDHPMYGKHLSEETKKKLSNALSGENNPNYGKEFSDDTKLKMHNAKIGKYDGDKNPMYGVRGKDKVNAKKVAQYDLDGNLIKIWDCIKEAADSIGIFAQNISACCRGIIKKSGGYIWKYVE